jgi:hypothetical protein
VDYEDAFETAIELSHDPAALDAFLATVPSLRGRLDRDLALALAAGRDLRRLTPDPAATMRRQRELLDAVDRHAEQRPVSWAVRLRVFRLRPGLVVTAALVALVAVLAAVAGLPAVSDGGGTITAEAVVIEGSVAEIGEGAVTINTASSAELVRLSSETVLTDGFGNTVQPTALNTGQTVVLKGSRSSDGLVASSVELKDRLFGTISAISGDGIRLLVGQTEHPIAITPSTEIEAPLRVGAFVEVKVLRLSDGSLRALEIEAEEEEGDDRPPSKGILATPAAPSANPTPNTPSSGDPKDGGDDGESGEADDHSDEDSHTDEDEHAGDDEDSHADEDEHEEEGSH